MIVLQIMPSYAQEEPLAIMGVLDLRNYQFSEDSEITLAGDWKFYKDTFLFGSHAPSSITSYIKVPYIWDEKTHPEGTFSRHGYATYSLQVFLPKRRPEVAIIQIGSIVFAYNLYLNGTKIASCGQPGKSQNEEIPHLEVKMVPVSLYSDTLFFTIHMSNFHHRIGGVNKPISIMVSDKYIRQRNIVSLIGFITFGILITIGVLHIILWLQIRKEMVSLYFGAAAIFIALRILFTGDFLINNITDISGIYQKKIEFLLMYSIPYPLLMYVSILFPKYTYKNFINIIFIITGTFFLITLFTTSSVFTLLSGVSRTLVVIIGLYLAFSMARAALAKEPFALLFFISFLLFNVAVLYDIINSLYGFVPIHMTPFGLLGFIFTQSSVLITNYLKAFRKNEELSMQLQETNMILEDKVSIRTAELEDAMAQLAEKNEEIMAQNEIVDKHQREVALRNAEMKSSMKYAARIQAAFQTENAQIKKLFPESFVFFAPRDVLSGDFYWSAPVGDKTLVAVADCTGHGVPGAMMSMLGMAFLNEVLSLGVYKPNIILDALREKVKMSLRQTEQNSTQKDGMDIALCLIDTHNKCIEYSGAFISAYLVYESEIKILAADKNPIAVYYSESPFSVQKYNYRPGEMLYLSSDGFADQFGGEEVKKFKPHRFKTMMLDAHQMQTNLQQDFIKETFYKWKANYSEQIDDVTVLGIRLK